jgi:hypothetical protein
MIHEEWLTVDKDGATVVWSDRDQAVDYLLRRVRYGLTAPDQVFLRYRTVSDWYDIRVVDKTDAPV